MTYFDDYKQRVGSFGISESHGMHQIAEYSINQNFENSPDYRIVQVGDSDVEIRYTKSIGKDGFKQYGMLLRPKSYVDIGSLVKIDDILFLITDFISDSLTSKATITMCNSFLKWQDTDGEIIEYKSITSAVSRFKLENTQIGSTLSADYVFMYVQRNDDTDRIVPSQRFIIGGKVYQVMGVDNLTGVNSNRIGLTEVTLTITTSMDGDDFISNIANNSSVNNKKTKKNGASESGNLW